MKKESSRRKFLAVGVGLPVFRLAADTADTCARQIRANIPGKGSAQAGSKGESIAEVTFTVCPIGIVRKTQGRTLIVLDRKYQPGLLGLDSFSHVYVLWWFNRNDTPEGRATLQVHPRGNRKNPMTGVFATRSPRRPNLIALTLCKIVSVKENVVEVEAIDALADTPVLDLKPFIPGYDSTVDTRSPEWAGPN